jgi:hypothetical protein
MQINLQILRHRLDAMARLQGIQAEDLHQAWLRAADVRDQLKNLISEIDMNIEELRAHAEDDGPEVVDATA